MRNGVDVLMEEPIAVIEGHKGPVYDLKFYDDGKEALLFRFGISLRICFYFSMLHCLVSSFWICLKNML